MEIKYDKDTKKTRFIGARNENIPSWKHEQTTVVIRDDHESGGHYLAWYHLGKVMITYLSFDHCIGTIKDMIAAEKEKALDEADEKSAELAKFTGGLKEIMEHATAD